MNWQLGSHLSWSLMMSVHLLWILHFHQRQSCLSWMVSAFMAFMHALSCLSLCNPMDCSWPCSSVHEISQVKILEWVAISSSRGSSQCRDQTHVSGVSCTAGRFFTIEPPGKPCGINGRIQIIISRIVLSSSPWLLVWKAFPCEEGPHLKCPFEGDSPWGCKKNNFMNFLTLLTTM